MNRSFHSVDSLASVALSLKLGIGLLCVAFLPFTGCAAHHDVGEDEAAPAVATDEAIVHGAADKGRHPAVVALIAEDGDGTALCSASLIAPDVLLTARHCVSYLRSESVTCPGNGAQVTGERPPSSLFVVLGDDASSAPVARGAEIFVPNEDQLCDADIALVRLDRAIDSVTPLPLARKGPASGGEIVAVGFGKNTLNGGAGVKRFRTDVPITATSRFEFLVGESTCSGDSGGPALDVDTGAIFGVVSRGPARCDLASARNTYTRIDAWAELVDHALASSKHGGGKSPGGGTSSDAGSSGSGGKPPGNDVGDPCKDGSTCASGVCVEHSYCSRKCGTDVGRCPSGFHCTKATASSTTRVCARAS